MTFCSYDRPGVLRSSGVALAALALLVPCAADAQPQRLPAPAVQHERFGPGTGGAMHRNRAEVLADFHTALAPYGRWQRHSRWGDVWVPANRTREWRPYTVGRWVYTDDWGWYWVSSDEEAQWGWATYHYGRWVYDDNAGWCWIAGEEWSPGWVEWRRGGNDVDYIGWAPLPPDEVVAEYWDQPNYWLFVRGRDFAAPLIASVLLPWRQYGSFLQRTVVVNRTVALGNRGYAVNPGIQPAIIARYSGRPMPTYNVRPVVLAGTTRINGATEVRGSDLANRRVSLQTRAQQTAQTVRAAQSVEAPRALGRGEGGRLGDNPPRAASSNAPATTGSREQVPTQQQPRQGNQVAPAQQQPRQGNQVAPAQQQPRQGNQVEQGGRQQQQPSAIQGRERQQQMGRVPPAQSAPPAQNASPRPQPPSKQTTEGRSQPSQQLAPAVRGQERQQGQSAERARPNQLQQSRPPVTEGRGNVETRQPQQQQQMRQGQRMQQQSMPSQQVRPQAPQRAAPALGNQAGAPGRAAGAPPAQPRMAAPPAQPRMAAPTTEGRGGGGAAPAPAAPRAGGPAVGGAGGAPHGGGGGPGGHRP